MMSSITSPSGEMHLLMRAEAVGGEVLVVGRAIDREGAPGMVEADDVLLLDIVDAAGLDPFSHFGVSMHG